MAWLALMVVQQGAMQAMAAMPVDTAPSMWSLCSADMAAPDGQRGGLVQAHHHGCCLGQLPGLGLLDGRWAVGLELPLGSAPLAMPPDPARLRPRLAWLPWRSRAPPPG